MGLMQKAIETYDAMEHLAGVEIEGRETLAPIGHLITGAKIEITIDRNGAFIQARAVDMKIVIPVTEKSSGRTSKPEAHPLCEQLGYMLPGTEKYSLYLKGLEAWAGSEFTNPKINAILQYVKTGTIAEDLAKADLIKYDEKGKLKNEKDMICWIVHGLGEKSGPVWNDLELQKEFQKYYEKTQDKNETVTCMLTGVQTAEAGQHLKGVFSFNGNAKIISANDKANFTYLGRFMTDQEALTVGYEASQKAHNALKWLISNQGTVRGGRAFLCWNPHGRQTGNPMNPLCQFSADQKPSPTEYRDQLRKAIDGYKAALPDGEEVIIASFDAATTGRLAIAYYAELQGSDFIERLALWDGTCCWFDRNYGTSSPALNRIIERAFGVQRGNDENAKIEIDDKNYATQLEGLLSCKLNKELFPTGILRSIVAKAENLQIYNRKNRRDLLFTACAVIRKYYIDHYKEEIGMALEPGRHDRSYQFGRLLAVMEKIERDTFDAGEEREPNAMRLQSIFVQRPAYATKIIMDQLKNGYYPRLRSGQRVYYDRLIGDIMEEIDSFGAEAYNRPLTETYLPGYYLQKNALYTKKEEKGEN